MLNLIYTFHLKSLKIRLKKKIKLNPSCADSLKHENRQKVEGKYELPLAWKKNYLNQTIYNHHMH